MLAATPACVFLREGTAERPLVADVQFLGNEDVGDDDLAAAIVHQPTSWLPFTEGHYLDPAAVERDVERIERYYQARGYYRADVEGWRLGSSRKGRVDLGFVIEEGSPTRVRELVVAGLADVPEPDRLFVLTDLPLHEGEIVTETAYDATLRELRERLRQRGYAYAEVEGVVRVHPEDGTAEVRFDADTGERFRLGPITVQGTEAVSKKPILWAAALESGMRYDETALDDAQGDVYDLGVFRAVTVDVLDPADGTRRLPVVIRVREAPLQAVEVGVGGGADFASQRVRGRVTWRHRDLFGGLDKLETTLRGGWAVVPTVVDPFHDGPIWGADVTFQRPNFLLRRHLLGAQLRYDHEVEPAFDVDSARAAVGVDRTGDWYGIGAGYGLELYRLTNFRTAPPSVEEDERFRPDRCPEPCTISFVEPRAWIDRRDSVLTPHRGWYAALLLEKGGGLLGGTHEYWKVSPEVRAYVTPFERGRLTIAGRARVGWLAAQSGGSPVVRRWFGGGPDSHRGYGARRLSPMVAARGPGTVPIGGDYLVESSLETRFRITGNFDGALFVDAGQVGFSKEETFDPANFAWAVGPGLRYRTPIGPVRLDIGYRVSAPERRTVDAANERVDEPLWTFHLGIGEAF